MKMQPIEQSFAERIQGITPSFIREILKVTHNKDIISFAGGLPNDALFPLEHLKQASLLAFEQSAEQLLQYSHTEGDFKLRQWIAQRYQTQNVAINAEDILITNGSQQALDLLGKVFLNKQDAVIIENPGYLGALQAFRLYQANFLPVAVHHQGMDTTALQQQLAKHTAKLIYTVPNFQNPTGISYSEENRRAVAQQVAATNSYLIQDDPYGELRFSGHAKSSFYNLLPQQTLLLGSFSKTIAPAFRLGWIVAPNIVMKKLIIAKQAADLHSNSFTQRILSEYLNTYNFDQHLATLSTYYGQQKKTMETAIHRYFPKVVELTQPEGGLFLWCTLDKKVSALTLFQKAIKKNVAFVPGESFYAGEAQKNTLRLNYSCADKKTIEEGIKRIGELL